MKVDPDFWRRLKLYGIGFGIGMLIVSVLFKDRSACKMPGTVKREELQKQKFDLTPKVICLMKCKDISTADIARVIVRGSINYGDESDPQKKPYGTYAIDGETEKEREIRVMIEDRDTISRIIDVKDIAVGKEAACNCE